MTDGLLPLRCPTCSHERAQLYIASNTVLTVRCARCMHIWCVDLTTLPGAMHQRVKAMRDGE